MTGAVPTCSQGVPVPEDKGRSNASAFGSLIAAARSGDEQALSDLIQECRNYLLLVANQDLHSEVQAKLGASDLVQETMLSAHRDFERFQGATKGEFLAWVRGILKNDLREAHRHFRGVDKRKVDRESPLDDSRQIGEGIRDHAITPGTNALKKEQAVHLNQAMETLSAEHRTVLKLRNWQQLSFAEIGKQMNRSEDAARKLWARAVVQLQSVIKDFPPS